VRLCEVCGWLARGRGVCYDSLLDFVLKKKEGFDYGKATEETLRQEEAPEAELK
jgi:transposase